jgi:hypothetical protein
VLINHSQQSQSTAKQCCRLSYISCWCWWAVPRSGEVVSTGTVDLPLRGHASWCDTYIRSWERSLSPLNQCSMHVLCRSPGVSHTSPAVQLYVLMSSTLSHYTEWLWLTQSPTPHCGGLYSIPGLWIWDLWWTEWHWKGYPCQYCYTNVWTRSSTQQHVTNNWQCH